MMRRRQFITLLGGAAAAGPIAARAQQPERMPRVGALISLAANDPEGQARIAAFLQGLQELGWSVGRNVRIDIRWSAGSADDVRKYAAELVTLAPDVILSNGAAWPCAHLEARASGRRRPARSSRRRAGTPCRLGADNESAQTPRADRTCAHVGEHGPALLTEKLVFAWRFRRKISHQIPPSEVKYFN